ncbi:MAG: Rpn family recombination-promoting nuclease/putative transposase, partial [Spirochaetales bacterium]|nr:Rpn family recombination-promoting nuclease/putative transposase [Spirochaetales bacterium]
MSDNFITGNRQYKDRLFIFLFGKEERKEWTLELYNAINGTDYKDPSAIEINTLENVLYVSMHNDVSFILDGALSIFEHQSSPSPNMPLRMLDYLVGLYDRYCAENGYNPLMYSRIPLPVPRFVVFSNWE